MSLFSIEELEAIARAFGDTEDGLTNSEIDRLFAECGLPIPEPGTKWRRLLETFALAQSARRDRKAVLAFIRKALKPIRYVKQPQRFDALRMHVNHALLLCGLQVEASGIVAPTEKVGTISEARHRARQLTDTLSARGVHPDVLDFCRAELVADNYFHAVLEAVKSIADKIRLRTGLSDDGGALVDRALSGSPPMLAINGLQTESERSEQKGFANLVRGTFSMFRNPTAHEARVRWQMKKEDAEDLLTLVSLIHRRLDDATMPPRI